MSIKGRLFHLLMRCRHLLKGQWKREVVDRNTPVGMLRQDCDQSAAKFVKLPEGIRIIPEEGSPVYSEWIIPENDSDRHTVLYFHGGGFVMGNAKSHRGIVSGFVSRLGVRALVFDYRLAPEHPAPAAVCDGAAMHAWLLAQGFQPENIIFAGDSAGGGIAVGTLLKLKDDRLPLPSACAVFSPSLDMTMSGASHHSRAKADPCTPKGMTETFYAYYVGDGDYKQPYASPLFGNLGGLPPIKIQVGNDETLRDDSVRFAEKAKEAGVQIEIKIWKGMFHCFPLLAPMFREATEALDETCGFIRKQLKLSGDK